MIPFDELQIPPDIIPWLIPISIVLVGIALSSGIIYIGSLWLVYAKAGRSGWLIFVPIINIYVLLRIAGRPGWHFLLLFIPLVNLFVIIFMWIGLAKVFGKSTLFGLGLIFFNWIFVVALAFGQSEYQRLDPRKRYVDDFQPINVRPS
jgi:Family of unknown function (DUF5684)